MAVATDATNARAFRPEMAAQLGTSTKRPGWDLETEQKIGNGEMLAHSLGWFSIGLGMVELLATERLARWLGAEDRTDLIRAYGIREIGTGIAVLSKRRPAEGIWARVAGDGLDLSTLATGLVPRNRNRGNVAIAMAAVAGVTALDVLCGIQLSTRKRLQD
jgi:hypothetical protein